MKKVMRKKPGQERSRITVGIIIQAAEKILAKEGAKAFNTNRIAEVAGVSIGSVYQYFPSKEAILSELVKEYFEFQDRELLDFFEQIDFKERTPLQVLEEMIKKHYQIIFSQPPISRKLLKMAGELNIDGDLDRITKKTIQTVFQKLKQLDKEYQIERKKLAIVPSGLDRHKSGHKLR